MAGLCLVVFPSHLIPGGKRGREGGKEVEDGEGLETREGMTRMRTNGKKEGQQRKRHRRRGRKRKEH